VCNEMALKFTGSNQPRTPNKAREGNQCVGVY